MGDKMKTALKEIQGLDKECVTLCKMINQIVGLRTICSCCGHGEETFKIWFQVDSLEDLPLLLYYCDPCHVGFRWVCTVKTDCGMSPVTFLLESESKGDKSYLEAEIIVKRILEHIDNE